LGLTGSETDSPPISRGDLHFFDKAVRMDRREIIPDVRW